MFSFEYPEYLRLLWLLPVVVWVWSVYLWWRRRAFLRLASPSTQERVLPGWSVGRFWLKNALLLVALALLVVAAANPRRGVVKTTAVQQSADVFIALDISNSMGARDVAPSRLEFAKVLARRLVRALAGERIGLVFFAGSAYVAMPLTTDSDAADMVLRTAAPELISTQGSDIGAALLLAAERFDPDPNAGRAIILLSDGEDHENRLLEAVERLQDLGIVVFSVVVGSEEGAPLIMADGQYKRDEDGQLIRSRADKMALCRLASATRGECYDARQGDALIEAIRLEIAQLDRRAVQRRASDKFESYYSWFALPAFLLIALYAALGWRRRMFLLGAVGLAFAPVLSAQSAQKLLRQGDALYGEGRYAEAEAAYRQAQQQALDDPRPSYNLGHVLYRQGRYPEAQQAWERALSTASAPEQKADIWYNLGNAFAQQNRWEAAIRAYENSLRLRPGDPDAKVNLQLAQKKRQQKQASAPSASAAAANNQQPPPSANPTPPPQAAPSPSKRMTPEEANRLLEAAVVPQDQNNYRKYHQLSPEKHQLRPRKDW